MGHIGPINPTYYALLADLAGRRYIEALHAGLFALETSRPRIALRATHVASTSAKERPEAFFVAACAQSALEKRSEAEKFQARGIAFSPPAERRNRAKADLFISRAGISSSPRIPAR